MKTLDDCRDRWGPWQRRLHLFVGLVGLVGFLLTGQYMDRVHDHLRGMDEARRLLFRSCHIYLLFGSLLNLALGLYLVPRVGWRRWVAAAGSALVLAGPFFAALGFFTEPWLSDLERPYSRPAISGSLAGMLLHLICWSPRGGPTPRPPDHDARRCASLRGRSEEFPPRG
jgi:hypothetical protein